MRRWLGLSALVVALDQVLKYAVAHTVTPGESVEVTSFFNLVLTYNRGAAFSFLSNAAGWQRGLFIGIALLVAVWIVYLLRRHPAQTLFCFALALVLGGAVGNLIDRVVMGAVADFLDFHAFGYHWPAFNLADSAITCGAMLLILEGLLKPAGAAPRSR